MGGDGRWRGERGASRYMETVQSMACTGGCAVCPCQQHDGLWTGEVDQGLRASGKACVSLGFALRVLCHD